MSKPNNNPGIALGLLTYTVWGFFPLYFKGIIGITPLEILAQRIVWAVFVLAFILVLTKRIRPFVKTFSTPRSLAILSITTVLISGNWLAFLYAVAHNEVLQCSLGYFLCPLFSVLLGVVFLKEKMGPAQLISVGLASIGLAILALHLGTMPWIALILAFSFGLYGLLRKMLNVDAIVGISVEMIMIFPLATSYLIWINLHHQSGFPSSHLLTNILLPLTGIATAAPLIWFSQAARHLKLSTLGFMQYITPTLQFLLATLAFHESFSGFQLISYLLIWLGLGLFSVDSWQKWQKNQ